MDKEAAAYECAKILLDTQSIQINTKDTCSKCFKMSLISSQMLKKESDILKEYNNITNSNLKPLTKNVESQYH